MGTSGLNPPVQTIRILGFVYMACEEYLSLSGLSSDDITCYVGEHYNNGYVLRVAMWRVVYAVLNSIIEGFQGSVEYSYFDL